MRRSKYAKKFVRKCIGIVKTTINVIFRSDKDVESTIKPKNRAMRTKLA